MDGIANNALHTKIRGGEEVTGEERGDWGGGEVRGLGRGERRGLGRREGTGWGEGLGREEGTGEGRWTGEGRGDWGGEREDQTVQSVVSTIITHCKR